MRPALSPGDLVLVDRQARPASGQIALVQTERHGRFLHRIVEMGEGGSVRTQGDANAIADFDALPETAVIGPVTLVIPVGTWLGR